ncbi:T9SS type A sorting domain-containing protein [uncultured Winogradskyella sp.]|uniref:T9SS type A sorting domain-containing protein n=1 Tax=uncultured Winogradskyella sp. TaxID=395353 RepID=UPI002629CC52|nr:T9SS type A sorting domain-containing protein [uncultured Winogradskyella sp.]
MKKTTLLILSLSLGLLGYSQSLPLDFEVAEDDNFGGFNGTAASVVVDPTDGTNQVLEMVGAGVDFDGAAITLDTYIDLSDDNNNTITMEIWAPDATTRTHLLKLEGGSSGATELFFDTTVSGWQTVSVDFGAGLGNEYPVLVIFTDSGSGNTATGTYYIDDIDGPNGAAIAVDPVPPTVAPVPNVPDAEVYSIYNDTNGYTTNFPVAYAFGTSQGEVDLDPAAGVNNALKMNFTVAGWGQGEGGPDDLTAYDFVSFDYWASSGTPGFRFVLIDNDGAVEEFNYEVGTNEAVVNEAWTSVEIPMTYFTGLGFSQANLFQWKVDPFMQSVAQGGIVYFDNIIFTANSLSTNEFETSKFEVFPNPTTNAWNLKSNNDITSVEVHDILGKRVLALQPNLSEFTINASELNDGIYLAKITTANGTKTVKLVKN